MNTSKLFAAALVTAAFGLGSAHAATIINLDATKSTGPFAAETDAATVTLTFAAGTYTVSVIDNTANGGYSGWNYNTGPTIREAFDFQIGNGPVVAVDVSSSAFTSYASSSAALSAFATGPYYFFTGSGTHYDAVPFASLPSLEFTVTSPTTVTFGIPDNLFRDNKGGVSLAITAAVPEPETYAMMAAGLGMLAFVSRRRKSA